MKFDSNCKAIIESMNYGELEAYVYFLGEVEIPRHREDIVKKLENNRERRATIHMLSNYKATSVVLKTLIKLNQTAIYRHRQDIKSTRECILRAEDRMEMLEFLS